MRIYLCLPSRSCGQTAFAAVQKRESKRPSVAETELVLSLQASDLQILRLLKRCWDLGVNLGIQNAGGSHLGARGEDGTSLALHLGKRIGFTVSLVGLKHVERLRLNRD